jgi:1-acyl-sn-glycerol-3-phosphate acyltransferase
MGGRAVGRVRPMRKSRDKFLGWLTKGIAVRDLAQRVGRETLAFRLIPHLLLEIMDRYFRLEVEGIEHIPRRGPAIIVPNHSGFAGFDAMLLSHQIVKRGARVPRVLTHRFWFWLQPTEFAMRKMGFVKATMDNGVNHLQRGHVVVLFPEGEAGNFKPTSKAYELQEFRRGFVRMAARTGAPIIPAVIIGAEETHINLSRLRWGGGLSLPLPFNLFPLPVRWKIKFLEPVHLGNLEIDPYDNLQVRFWARRIRSQIQEQLTQELQRRKGVFIERPPWLRAFFGQENDSSQN